MHFTLAEAPLDFIASIRSKAPAGRAHDGQILNDDGGLATPPFFPSDEPSYSRLFRTFRLGKHMPRIDRVRQRIDTD